MSRIGRMHEQLQLRSGGCRSLDSALRAPLGMTEGQRYALRSG
jgi:hypothetical protein